MEKYYDILSRCGLFADISKQEIVKVLGCLGASVKNYRKQSTVFIAGDRVQDIYILLSGGIQIAEEDFWGYRSIITEIMPAGLFGEAFACAGGLESLVTSTAIKDSEVMVIPYPRILQSCGTACSFHIKLNENMLKIVSFKNIELSKKNRILCKRTTREKLMEYFAFQILAAGSTDFTIPFDRGSLADYLCVDRSAMSRELSKMREEGIITFDKSSFSVIRPEAIEDR